MSELCLFSNEPLDANTKVEHTIPEGVGGRITSTIVSCTKMNELAGSLLDDRLKNPYKLLFNILGPGLPERMRAAVEVTTPTDPLGLILNDTGSLTRRNVIVEKDAVGAATAVLASDEGAARKVAQQIRGPSAPSKVSTVPATAERILTERHLAVSAEIDVAALRALLLTFDHVLHGGPHRFTRSPQIRRVREFMHRTILGNPLDRETLRQLTLGIQYEKLSTYQRIRQSVSFDETPFEHVLIASADRSTRTIDLVWVFAQCDPYAFRICNDWDGDAFTYVVVNGILSGATASGALSTTPAGTLGRPTLRCSFPNASFNSEEAARAAAGEVMAEIGGFRRRALERALLFVESDYDDVLIERLTTAALLTGNAMPVAAAMEARLTRLFACAGNAAAENVINQAVNRLVKQLPPSIGQEGIPVNGPATLNWGTWLRVYRDALSEVQQQLSPLGGVHSKGVDVQLDVAANRKIGDVRPAR